MKIEVTKINGDYNSSAGRIGEGIANAIWTCVQMGGGKFEIPNSQRTRIAAISHFMVAAGIGQIVTRKVGSSLLAIVTVIRADND